MHQLETCVSMIPDRQRRLARMVYDVKQADNFGPVCSLSLVDAIRHASMTRSVRRMVVVVGDVCWRLEKHTLAEEILSTDRPEYRLYQPEIWRAIHLIFRLSVHALEKERVEVM